MAAVVPAHAVVDDPNFVETEVLTTSEPFTGLAWAPDGSDRLFLTRKEGLVQIMVGGALLPTPFATLSPVFTGSECGLVGMAFDPNYGRNGFVYFFVTVSNSEQQIIRYRDDGNVGVEPTPVVTGLPTNGVNHDGGAIGFGPDGKLYWAIGDLGGYVGGDSDLTSMAAKVGRVNRDGTVPGDNPFDDGAGPHDERIWARGFRNPFTMTFQPSTGELWLNVVGSYVEQIFMVGRGDHGGYVEYESFQPGGFIAPKIHYRTNGSDTYALTGTGAVRESGVVRFTTAERNWLHQGERVTISGVNDPSFDGVAFVKDRLSETVFSIEQAGPDARSGGGDAVSPALGGCVTGGTFYDSTAATAEYRGNFFFGDLNSGLIMRARLSGTTVLSVEPWASGHRDIVNIDVGPDGDLYHVSYNGPGGVFRERFQPTSQGLVVSKTNIWMLEDGVSAFNVRLAMEPTETVRVAVARVSGDESVSVSQGGTLVFDGDDWLTPKVVRLAAEVDRDTTTDVAEIAVTSSGLPTERVTVRVIDEIRADPPGQGGEGGASDGEAGRATGGSSTAGEAGDSTGGLGGTSGGRGGTSSGMGAEGGEGDAGSAANTANDCQCDGGCGCTLVGGDRGGSGVLLAALFLLRKIRRFRGKRR